MTVSDEEKQRILRARREMEQHLKEVRHLIEPETERMIREQQQKLRDIIDPASLLAFREGEEAVRVLLERSSMAREAMEARKIEALVSPAIQRILEERDAVQRALDSSAVREFMVQRDRVDKMMREMGESLALARNVLAHSIFSAEFVTGVEKLAAECCATTQAATDVVRHVAEQLKPIDLSLSAGRLVEMFRPIDLTRFAENFRHIEAVSRAAELVAATVRWESLGDRIGVVNPEALQLESFRLNTAYARYAEATALAPEPVIDAPFMAKVPALAVYSHARVVRAITTHTGDEPVVEIWSEVREETTSIIETTLPRIRPALLVSWRAGLATVRRRESDWVRQASSSLRYVLIETLDAIAPRDRVLAGGPDKKYLSSKGEPTRAAQVRWLCRSLKNKDYRDMMVSELDSAIETIDAMNTAVHREDYPEIEEAFDRMCVRAEIALRDLLEIFKMGD
ncbi:MAG: hypothetical protein KGN76_18455 [Acidobacteriota bacterium]|nr:hypothetical protein [Acidobacteriota bacterium]